MKAVRRNLSINIEYGDMNEVLEALEKIKRSIRSGKLKYNRQKENTAIYEWAIDRVESEDYTEQVIQGQLCQVFKSRM